jgi:hypothetical protein
LPATITGITEFGTGSIWIVGANCRRNLISSIITNSRCHLIVKSLLMISAKLYSLH